MAKLYTVMAEVAPSSVKGGYRVKVSLPEIGLYINGMMVYPPNEQYNEWSVLTPARPAGRGRYARIVEFNKKLPLWEEIYDECVLVAKIAHDADKDVVITDIPDGPISLDEIPF